jgi:phosphate transport system protein
MPIPGMDDLKGRLVAYGQFVQQMIEKSRSALVSREPDLPRQIIDTDEPRANQTEIDLEAECTSLIARHQPMARDLRTILMVMGITNDLERMADHAVNIAEAVGEHINGTSLRPDNAVLQMFEETISMVDGSIRAFISEDAALGQRVCESDNIVDDLATRILEGLSATMTTTPASVPESLALLKIAGNLERVADLSTNIGEDVIYMTEGRVIKHHREEEAREP